MFTHDDDDGYYDCVKKVYSEVKLYIHRENVTAYKHNVCNIILIIAFLLMTVMIIMVNGRG